MLIKIIINHSLTLIQEKSSDYVPAIAEGESKQFSVRLKNLLFSEPVLRYNNRDTRQDLPVIQLNSF